MNHRREVHRQLLESGGDPPALLEPAVALLDRAALAAGLAIEADPAIARVLVAAPEDHGPDRVAAQPLADARGAAALVAGERFRAPAAADVDAVHDRFEIRALVDLAGRDVGGEGGSVTLSNRWILLPSPPRERPRAWSSGSWEPPLPGPRGRLRSAHRRAVHAPQVPVDVALRIEPDLERLQHPLEHPLAPPGVEVRAGRLPRRVSLGQVAPRGTTAQHPRHRVPHLA